MITVKETAGDSLTGAIDGANRVFVTSFDYDDTSVNVYLNGILLQADLETGYDLILPRSIVMKEAPLSDPDGADTLEVEYRANIRTGGGALGGSPDAPSLAVVSPDRVRLDEDIPDVETDELSPRNSGGVEDTPTVVSNFTLTPTVFTTADPEDC